MASDRERFAALLRARHPLVTVATSDEDRSVEAVDGDIVVASADDGFVIRRLRRGDAGWVLDSAGPGKPRLAVDPEAGIQVWGVVAASITEHCQR